MLKLEIKEDTTVVFTDGSTVVFTTKNVGYVRLNEKHVKYIFVEKK